jgi:hypothetical protein
MMTTAWCLPKAAIDALSHAALHPDGRTRYASIGGEPNPKQPGLIRAEILRMPAGSAIVSAMVNDAAGPRSSRRRSQNRAGAMSFSARNCRKLKGMTGTMF